MYSMKKFTALQYAIFVIAAPAVLVAVPSAHAAVIDVDGSCPDTDDDTPWCDLDTEFPTVKSAIANATAGDTISVSAGTYDEGYTLVKKSLTIEPAANARVVLNGTTIIDVQANATTIQGIIFQNTTSEKYSLRIGNSTSGVTIHNNTFADTRGNALRVASDSNTLVRDLSVTDNVFKNIGTFYDPGLNAAQKAKKMSTAIVSTNYPSDIARLQDSRITGNTIDTTTHGGINLANTENILVANNTISNTNGNSIHVSHSNHHIRILGNHISGANNAGLNPTGGAIVVKANNTSHVTVHNNTISGGNNGILYCTELCNELPENRPGNPDPALKVHKTVMTDQTNLFTHNIFDNVSGYDIMNMARGPMIATHNYYGEAEPDFTAILFGDIRYNPYYNDPERRVLVDDGKGPVQRSTADVDVSDVCSVSLGSYIIDFADAKYGATSGIVQNQIKNAGNRDLDAIKFTTTGWLKPDGSALSGAVSRVGTDVASSASYAPIPTDPAGVNFDNRNFTGPNALPASGSSGSALVGFVLDLTGVATGAGVTVTESVTYSGTCS